MPKVKIILIIVFVLSFFVSLLLFLKFNTVGFEQSFRAYLAWYNPTDDNLKNFYDISTSQNFLSSLNFENQTFKNGTELFDFLRNEQKTNNSVPAVAKDNRDSKVPIQFDEENIDDTNLPQKITYVSPGVLGYYVYNYDLVRFSPDKNTLESKYLNLKESTIDPISKKNVTGTKDLKTAKTEVNSYFNKLITDVGNTNTYDGLTKESFKKLENHEVLENISVNSINFVEKNFKETELKDNKLIIGTINIHLENCFKDFSEDLSFSINTGDIQINDLNDFVSNLCKKQFVKVNGVITGTCTDCTYYPADKWHALRSDYTPKTQLIDFAPGGQYINTQAYNDFKDLYNAAKADGIYIYVTSGYRSYNTQVATYQGWVNTELAAGYSLSEAEAIANTYSALPGYSEHQLGTALDLNGAGCEISDGYCSTNETIWNWLAENAYKYGFAQSYPEGKESITGYTTERWHYRWIGKDLAEEYKKAGGGTKITLNVFLLNKGLY